MYKIFVGKPEGNWLLYSVKQC